MKLFEHRKRVPFLHWALLAAVMTAMLILGPIAAEAQEFVPFKQSTGLLMSGSELCWSPGLLDESITLLKSWREAVSAVRTYERGGAPVPEEVLLFGEVVSDNNLCVTTGFSMLINIVRGTEGYVLARFSEPDDRDRGTFIVSRTDILPYRGL